MDPQGSLFELGVLAAALCEGEITPDQAARLEELVGQSSRARRFLLEYLQLHGELCWEGQRPAKVSSLADSLPAQTAHGSAGDLAVAATQCKPIAGSPESAPRRLVSWRLTAVAAAAAVVLIGVLGWACFLRRPADSGQPSQPISVGQVVAHVVRSRQAAWSHGGELASGEQLAVGRQLDLRSGIVEIDFRPGARVVLEGPARLELTGPGQCELNLGKLTARISASISDEGSYPSSALTVRSPAATVVHRGTEFGVAVEEDGQTEVHVFSGTVGVELAGVEPKARAELGWYEVAAGKAIRVVPAAAAGAPQVNHIALDTRRFARPLSEAGTAAALREVVARHPRLIHHYTFEGASRREQCRDSKGDLDLIEVVMLGGRGGGRLEYACPGVDATTRAIRPFRAARQGNMVGVALQSEPAGDSPSGAVFVPPGAFTVELLLNFQPFAGPAEGQISAAIATRSGPRECGFFLVAVDDGRLVHLMDGDAAWVEGSAVCIPGDWYYVASTFRVQEGRTVVNTYLANVTRREKSLQTIVENRMAQGEPPAGPLGVGKGFDADLAHAYPWSGCLDEVAIYDAALSRQTLEEHLRALVGSPD